MARIISLEVGNADEGFLIIFNQMLQSYYKIDDNNLSTLLEENEERDQFLLADELKKKNILTFMKAIRIYLNREDAEKAKELGLDKVTGVIIGSVPENGAARGAGLKEGDVIKVKYKRGKCAGDGTGRKLKQKEA